MATANVPGVCVIVRKKNEALFIMRANTGFMDGMYVLPSGHVEADESFRQAAARELLEEVGLTVEPESLRYLHTVHRKGAQDIRIDVYFEALDWSGEPQNREPERHSAITWLPLDNLPENIADYQLHGIKNSAKGEAYSEFGWS